MALALYLAFLGAACAYALVDWRRGWMLVMVCGVIQDPVRKLTGEPADIFGFARRGYLREGVSLAQATDILWTCTSDELYDLLVTQRGWSPPQFGRFLGDYMIATLLPPAQ